MKLEKISNLPHYYIFKKLFLDYDEAIYYCDMKKIPYEFIVKTKCYINFKDQN